MLDFKDPSVFDSEKSRFKRFLNQKLSNLEEEEARESIMETEGDGGMFMDTEAFIGSEDAFDFGSLDNMDFDSDFGSSSGRSDIANDQSYVQDEKWKTILFSPYFLFVYVIKLLIFNTPKKEEWKQILQMLNKITMFSAGGSLLFWLLDFRFIFSFPFQAFTSLLMFGISTLLLKYVFKEGGDTENDDPFADTSEFGEMGDFGDFGDMSFEEGDVGGFGSGLGFDTDELSSMGSLFDDDDSGGLGDTSLSEFEGYTPDTSKDGILAPSPVDVSSDVNFDRTLLEAFKKNAINTGQEYPKRIDLINSLSDYIITNDRNFGSWDKIREGSVEYNNITYALFKGLGQIVNSFLSDEERLVVIDINSNPLLYRIEVELPSYFKQDAVQRRLKEISDAIKENDEDTDVEVYMSFFRGRFIFKFVRPNRNMISLGDILRFYDEDTKSTPLDHFADDSVGLPILFGLRQMEYPYFVDLEENTSGVIVGGSGSGKSWLTFLMMINFVISNDYHNLNFVIMDLKNAMFWNQFAKFPHVLGYHADYKDYLEIARELYEEVNRRKELLNEVGAENFKGLRKDLRKAEEYEELKKFPLLVIIVDEVTSTMQQMKTYYEDEKERYDEFRNILSQITQEGRSLGVRLVLIGQRAIDTSIPKNVMANASFKFGMKMDNEADFETIFGKDVASMPKPQAMGMGLSQTMGISGIHPLKTLTVGGTSDGQIGKFIRVLALEWVRRSMNKDDLMNQPDGMQFNISYNRDKFLRESFEDIEEGKILVRNKVNKGYSLSEIDKNTVRKTITGEEGASQEDIMSVLEESYSELDEYEDEGLESLLNEYSDEDVDDSDFDIDALINEVFNETSNDDGDNLSNNSLFDDSSEIDDDDEDDSVIDTSFIDDIFNSNDDDDEVDGDLNEYEDDLPLFDNDMEKSLNKDDDSLSLFNDEDDELPLFNEDNPLINNDSFDTLFTDDEDSNGISNDIRLDDSIEEEDNLDGDMIDFLNSPSELLEEDEDVRQSEKDLLAKLTSKKVDEVVPFDQVEIPKKPRKRPPSPDSYNRVKPVPTKRDKPQRKAVRKRKVVKKVRKQPTMRENPNVQAVRKDGGVKVDFNTPQTTGNFAPNMSIKEYIVTKGQKNGLTTYRIPKEKLIVIYGEQRIIEELEMLSIIEDGDFFVTQM